MAEGLDGAAACWTLQAGVPEHELNKGPPSLAFVYREHGELTSAAGEYERVAAESTDAELRRGARWRPARSTKGPGQRASLKVYLSTCRVPGRSRSRSRRASRSRRCTGRSRHGEPPRAAAPDLAIDAAAGRAQRARAHAGGALGAGAGGARYTPSPSRAGAAVRAEPETQKQRMDEAARRVRRPDRLRIGEVTAAAPSTWPRSTPTSDGADAIGAAGRSAPARAPEYELALEEEAYPFEEQAIKVHEKNLELIARGSSVLDREEPRRARAPDARPLRKPEASSGFIASIDTYAYPAPQPPPPRRPLRRSRKRHRPRSPSRRRLRPPKPKCRPRSRQPRPRHRT